MKRLVALICLLFPLSKAISQVSHFRVTGYDRLPVSGLGNHTAATADIDGDGDMDIFIGRSFQTDMLLLNNGQGYFTLSTDSSWQTTGGTYDALFTDINKDGRPDLILARGPENGGTTGWLPGRDQILYNIGGGKFREVSTNLEATAYDTANFSMAVATGDLNGDKRADFVFVNGCINYLPRPQVIKNFSLLLKKQLLENDVFFMVSDTDADFVDNYARQSPQNTGIKYSDVSSDVVIADFNKDGYNDIFITNYYDKGIDEFPVVGLALDDSAYFNKLYLNTPSNPGTFTWAKDKFPLIKYPSTSVAVDDINLDGYPDLVIANDGNATNSSTQMPRIFINDRTGGFTDQTLKYIPGFNIPLQYYAGYEVQVRDLTGDGLNDIFIAGQSNMLLVKKPDTTFSREDYRIPTQISTNEPYLFSTYSAAFADFDKAGGANDLILANSYEQIHLQLHTTTNFWEQATTTNLPVNGENNHGAVIADFNKDGLNDILNIVYNENATHTLYLNKGITNGAAQFEIGNKLPILFTNRNLKGVDATDINGDGYPDVMVSGQNGNRLFINNKNGTFKDNTPAWLPGFENQLNSNRARFVDINNDGVEDIFVPGGFTSGQANALYLWDKPTNKYLDFSAAWLPANNAVSLDADFKDVNKDGWKDILVTNSNQSITLLVSGTAFPASNPNYAATASFGINAASVAKFGDFNGDGLWDIAEASEDKTKPLRVFLNTGNETTPAFAETKTLPGGAIKDILVIDLNKDGRDDIITADFETSDVYTSNITGISGGFIQATDSFFPQSFCRESWFANAIATGDLNNDTVPDLYFARDNQDLLFYGVAAAPPPPPIGIQEVATKGTLKVYPNPATTHVWVNDGKDWPLLELYAINGQKITGCTQCNGLELQGIQPGIYILRGWNRDGLFTGKVVKD